MQERILGAVPKDYGQTCPVARSLAFLGERWTLLLVRDLLAGPRKFQDFSASLPGVAPTVLSQRLKVLETHGIVSRRLYSEHPPRAEYTLTERGMELRPVVRALGIWGARHIGANGPSSTTPAARTSRAPTTAPPATSWFRRIRCCDGRSRRAAAAHPDQELRAYVSSRKSCTPIIAGVPVELFLINWTSTTYP